MKYKQFFFIVLFLIFTYINGLKLKNNIKKHTNNFLNKSEKQKQIKMEQLSNNLDKMIKETKKDMNFFIKDAFINAKKEMIEEEIKNKK
jgi:hypothetical protein